MNNEKSAAKDRIEKLKELINDYRYHYHVLDESIMSEAAADSLKHELSQLEEQYPEFITPDSPTQRVAGKPLDKFQKVTHTSRMISLADVFSESEIRDWVARNYKLVDQGIELPSSPISKWMDWQCPCIMKMVFSSKRLPGAMVWWAKTSR